MDRKRAKYTALCDQYCFVPLAVETLGALGEEAATYISWRLVDALLSTVASREPLGFCSNV